MDPILFLDIDGVLNPATMPNYEVDLSLNEKLAKTYNEERIRSMNIYFLNQICFGFKKESCELIKKLVEEFHAKIVLTSSWRLFYSHEEIQCMFKILELEEAFLDFTSPGSPRNQVITEYIYNHHVKQYIVIDDFDMKQSFGYRFIQTAQYFNENNYFQARYALRLQYKE